MESITSPRIRESALPVVKIGWWRQCCYSTLKADLQYVARIAHLSNYYNLFACKCAFCCYIINLNNVSVLPICGSIIRLHGVRARNTSHTGKSVQSPSFTDAWGEQQVLWTEPGSREVLVSLYLICYCLIVVGGGRFSARGVSPGKGPHPWGVVVSAGQCGQSSRRSTWEMFVSSCIQPRYSWLVPVEAREETNHVFKVLCFSECCECKEVVLRLLVTYTYSRNKKMQTSNLRLFFSVQRSAYMTQTVYRESVQSAKM